MDLRTSGGEDCTFRLEEHDLLRGFLRNLPWQDSSGINMPRLCEAFFAIFGSPWQQETEKVSDKLVARASLLVVSGAYSTKELRIILGGPIALVATKHVGASCLPIF